jgi:hypothetical protein
MQLGELLVARNLISRGDLSVALARQEANGGRIGDNLIAMGLIAKKILDEALRAQYVLAKCILDAEDLLTKSTRILGNSDPKTNRIRCRLAAALVAGGRPEDALSVARTAQASLLQRLGHEHQWTKEAVQAVADATEAVERADAPADRQPEPVIGFGAPIIESRSDKAAPVVELTTRFVPSGAARAERLAPVRRIFGVLAGRR